MADLFGPTDIQRLLGGQHVLLLGDSITRAVYKVVSHVIANPGNREAMSTIQS
jgi:hypothetical protein